MKRVLLLIISLLTIMILAACSNTSAEVEKDKEETEEKVDVNDVKDIMNSSMIEGDKLIDVSIENDEIKVVVDIEESDVSPNDITASNIYSLASDELLNNFEGWNIFTVEYVDIGTVSMNRSQSESDNYGNYFSTEKIDEMLNVEY